MLPNLPPEQYAYFMAVSLLPGLIYYMAQQYYGEDNPEIWFEFDTELEKTFLAIVTGVIISSPFYFGLIYLRLFFSASVDLFYSRPIYYYAFSGAIACFMIYGHIGYKEFLKRARDEGEIEELLDFKNYTAITSLSVGLSLILGFMLYAEEYITSSLRLNIQMVVFIFILIFYPKASNLWRTFNTPLRRFETYMDQRFSETANNIFGSLLIALTGFIFYIVSLEFVIRLVFLNAFVFLVGLVSFSFYSLKFILEKLEKHLDN